MKVYVVTSLIESEEDGAEVNVIGIRKTKKEAYLLMIQALKELKENYEENDIEYEITRAKKIQISLLKLLAKTKNMTGLKELNII